MTDFTLGPGPLTPEFEQVKSDIGIVENGNTATHAIPAGYYVIWKGDLYIAKTDISSGTALSTSNLTAKTQGIGKDVAELTSKITPSGLKNGNIDAYFDQDICWIQAANSSGSQPGFNYYQLEIIPNGNGQILQRATEMSNSRIANRLYANGAWSPWEPVAFSREVAALNSNIIVGLTKPIYNANTDKNVESNRTTAMEYLKTNNFNNGQTVAIVRYQSGYYFAYLYFGDYTNGDAVFLELCHNLTSGEKLICWHRNNVTGAYTKGFTLS